MNVSASVIRRVVLISLAVIAFGAGAIAMTHWFMIRSDAYAAAVSYLKESHEVASAVGSVKAVRLSWLEHAEVEELDINGQRSGSAEFTLIVDGNLSSRAIEMRLSRDSRGWTVVAGSAIGDRLGASPTAAPR